MYYYNRKKELIKNGLIIGFILFIAIFATYHIYYKFEDERNIDYKSKTLDITFHQKTGNKVTLTKVTPVSDAVGLSSKEYTFTIRNNQDISSNYKIKLVDDKTKILDDQCMEYLIPKNIIKVSIKENNNDDKIYILKDLKDEVVMSGKIKSKTSKEYTVRVWTGNNTLPNGSELHYHGIIKIEEEK